jgi:hypothetical protein
MAVHTGLVEAAGGVAPTKENDMTDPNHTTTESDDTDGNGFRVGGAPSTVETDDTDANSLRFGGALSTVEVDDTEANNAHIGG